MKKTIYWIFVFYLSVWHETFGILVAGFFLYWLISVAIDSRIANFNPITGQKKDFKDCEIGYPDEFDSFLPIIDRDSFDQRIGFSLLGNSEIEHIDLNTQKGAKAFLESKSAINEWLK